MLRRSPLCLFLLLLFPLSSAFAQIGDAIFSGGASPAREAPHVPKDANYFMEIDVSGLDELTREKYFVGAGPSITDPFEEADESGKDVLSFIQSMGGVAESATWDGSNKVRVVGSFEQLKIVRMTLKPLCCSLVQVRHAIYVLALPAEGLRELLRHPDKLQADVLRRFSDGEGEVRQADMVLSLSGVQATVRDYALTATVAPDNKTINVAFEHRIGPDAKTSFAAKDQTPQLVTTELSGDRLECLVYTPTLVGLKDQLLREAQDEFYKAPNIRPLVWRSPAEKPEF